MKRNTFSEQDSIPGEQGEESIRQLIEEPSAEPDRSVEHEPDFQSAMRVMRRGFDLLYTSADVLFSSGNEAEEPDRVREQMDKYNQTLGAQYPYLEKVYAQIEALRQGLFGLESIKSAPRQVVQMFFETSRDVCARHADVLALASYALTIELDAASRDSLIDVFEQELDRFFEAIREIRVEMAMASVQNIPDKESPDENDDRYDAYDDEEDRVQTDNAVVSFASRRKQPATANDDQEAEEGEASADHDTAPTVRDFEKHIMIKALSGGQVRFWHTLLDTGLIKGFLVAEGQGFPTLYVDDRACPWFGATDLRSFVRINRQYNQDFPGKLSRVKDEKREHYFPKELFFDPTGKALEFYTVGDWDLFVKRPEYQDILRSMSNEPQ